MGQNEPYIFFSCYPLGSKNLELLLKVQNNLFTISIAQSMYCDKSEKDEKSEMLVKGCVWPWPGSFAPTVHLNHP